MAPRPASKRAASKGGGTVDVADEVTECQEPGNGEKPAKRPRKQNASTEATADKKKALQPGKQRPQAPAGDSDAADSGAEPVGKDASDTAAETRASQGDDDAGTKQSKAKGGNGKSSAKAAPKADGQAAATAPRDPPGPRYFLMKSEPEEFSLDDLEARPNQTSHWEGVRNAQARNIMRSMRLGDQAFFYHRWLMDWVRPTGGPLLGRGVASADMCGVDMCGRGGAVVPLKSFSSCRVPAVVGVVQVLREAYPDHFAFDKDSKYYDPSSTPESPKWWMVDVQLVRRMKRPVTLAELREEGARGPPVQDMVLIKKSRLSVQPVTAEQWVRILELEQQAAGQGEGEEEGQGNGGPGKREKKVVSGGSGGGKPGQKGK